MIFSRKLIAACILNLCFFEQKLIINSISHSEETPFSVSLCFSWSLNSEKKWKKRFILISKPDLIEGGLQFVNYYALNQISEMFLCLLPDKYKFPSVFFFWDVEKSNKSYSAWRKCKTYPILNGYRENMITTMFDMIYCKIEELFLKHIYHE